jgi:hypothetical protein
MKEYKNLKEFYPFYLNEHSNLTCRRLHFIGTTILLVALGAMIVKNDWSFIWTLPLIGYGFAWVGHFVFEKNRPATFKYPVLSFVSDFKMWFEIATGKIKF